ncbi:hypothetical protein BDB01DRAFT_234713 [Pilobolus umbonatus]|nr:hypothetical protein BDB01DRAFT_234713 [Pilobolus umbonatus]
MLLINYKTWEQAKKALARYNNDIARAADYIFSKNYVSDDELEEITTNVNNYSMDYSKEEADTKISEFTPSTRRNNSFTSIESTPMTPMNSNGMSEPAQWSVVPYTPKVPTSATVVEPSMTNKQYIEHSSLTWWRDPEDPSERTALIDMTATSFL